MSATYEAAIHAALRRGKEQGATHKYWKISAIAAGKVMRATFPGKPRPRPGYAVDLPNTTRDGYPGRWVLSNWGGQYELSFYYK